MTFDPSKLPQAAQIILQQASTDAERASERVHARVAEQLEAIAARSGEKMGTSASLLADLNSIIASMVTVLAQTGAPEGVTKALCEGTTHCLTMLTIHLIELSSEDDTVRSREAEATMRIVNEQLAHVGTLADISRRASDAIKKTMGKGDAQ